MEGPRGPPFSYVHLKGATLQGYRAGPFRSLPHPTPSHSNSSRRSSDSDVSESKLAREKCRKYEPRFFASYRSESPSGESGTITSDPKEPPASWESPHLAPQFSSRPTITPLAAPASPRPQGIRSFNTFPRPWKARSRSPSPFRAKDQTNKGHSDSFHIRSLSDSLKQIKLSMGGKRDEGGSENGKHKMDKNAENNNYDKTNNTSTKPVPFYNKVSLLTSSKENLKENSGNIYRSVATITVSQTNPKNSGFSYFPSSKYSCDNEPADGVNHKKKLINVSNISIEEKTVNKETKREIQQVVDEENARKSVESTSKYIWDVRGKKLCAPLDPHVTKFSSSGSSLPSIPDELGSAPLSCDEENCAPRSVSDRLFYSSVSSNKELYNKPSFYDYHGNEVVNTDKDLRFEKQGVSSGGSGPGDREAPLTESNAQSLMQASGRKIVRKKPQIPDKLYKRRSNEDGDQNIERNSLAASLLSPSHSFSSGVHRYKITKKNSLPSPVETQSHNISPNSHSTEEKTECGKSRTTVGQILSTLNFARFRLEELTGALGGGKKEGGKGPATSGRGPPSRPPRIRRDLENLRKSTEKLKSSDPKTDSDSFNKQSSDNVNSKSKIKTKSEGSKHFFTTKQSIVRTNSSPAATGASCASQTTLTSSFSDKSLSSGNKDSVSPQSPMTSMSSNFLLPPLPSSKQKPSMQSRDIPFRSLSVSQGELSNEKGSSRASPNLKLYPASKETWGSHTLPRCLSLNKGSDMETKKMVKTKSKSEMQLSLSDEDLSLSSQLSEPSNSVKKSFIEAAESSECSGQIEKGSIIEQLLYSDYPEQYSVSEKNVYSDSSDKYNLLMNESLQISENLNIEEPILERTNNNDDEEPAIDLGNIFDDSISVNIFEDSLEKNLKPQGEKFHKDICVQTEDGLNKDNDKSKRKTFRSSKVKSLEEKREKFKLSGDTKHLSTDLKIKEEKDKSDDKMQKFRKDANVVCRVVETEHRRSQCLVIRSSSFNKNKEGDEKREEEPSATSECRVVQTRPMLSLEDSEGESTDRERKCHSLRSDCNDERVPLEGIFSGLPTESSDSSSQDSVGIQCNRNKDNQSSFRMDETNQYTEKLDKNEFRRRKKGIDDNVERPPNKKEKTHENTFSNKTNKNTKKQENLKKFNRQCDQKSSLKNDTSISDGESRPNSYSEPESLQLVYEISHMTEKSERKKKNRSDPGLKRNKNDDTLAYFSDSNLEHLEGMNERQKMNDKRNQSTRSGAPPRGVVSQTSTDSEGRDELGPYKGNSQDAFRLSRSQTPRFSNPHVILSGQDSDTSYQDVYSLGEYAGTRNISRNASPSPYLGDSDSGERCTTRSPHGPRRYSKRPLRGPYGEMLEAEMSKSKSSSQFLSDDLYLRPRESNSTSPRPSSPVSPSTAPARHHNPFETSPSIFVGNDNGASRSSTNSIPASRSLDDSALRLFYSASHSKNDNHLKPLTMAQFSTYESDSEGGLTPHPSGPIHQRTASSPSKLFFEPGCTSEEDQDMLAYYATPPKLSSECSTQSSPKEDETKTTQAELINEETIKATRIDLSEETTTKTKQHSKNKQERHSKSPKGKKTHQEEEPRSHSLQQNLKKGALETEFRSLTEHRHAHRRHRDTRAHIIGEIHDTEKNYVDNLNFLLTRYEQHLRTPESSLIIEPALVDDIFFQVPEIHDHHQRLLEELKRRLDCRDANICVGPVLLQMLKDKTVAESYKSFVNNWKTAQESAKAAAQTKPAFRHFLVAMAKEHPGKLDLKALLITPVQRFPHYELILKRLLEHTSRDHPDHGLVKEAILEVQKVAASINDIEQEALQLEQQQFILKEIENYIEGLVLLVQPDRTFLQLDLVTQNSGLGIRKERCLFLFSDILVITAIKRRSATIRKSSSLQLPFLSSLESCKLKLFKFISLDDLEIGRSRDDSLKKLLKELESLEQDLQTVSQISRLIKTLHFPKGSLEDVLHDLDASLKKQLMERQGADSQLSELELNITTQEGIESVTFMFSSAEKRNKWEEGFNAAKQKLAMSADRRPPPEFINALPIRKTRAGLQFTCAAPTLGLNTHDLRDVWVCNSDGYVGQVCVMSLQPEPTLACCNGVCNAKILSIASIPAAPHPDSSDEDEEEEMSVDEDLRKRRSESLPPEMGTVGVGDETDHQQPTMWLGTEDGSIHVYNCSDTIRTKKNKFKFQPGSPVHCIIHIENRVFASLANGDVVVYERDANGGWNFGQRHVVSLSTAAAPVTKMVVAAGKLWCSATNSIRILNINNLQVEHSFMVGGEGAKGVACMVCAGHGVWVATHASAVVRLYHAATHECVCEVTVTNAVTKMLAGCDDIIRQHKLAILKVTSLLACKDLLWVGTSAGVIITLPLPHLSHNTRRLQTPLNLVGIPHGHTGNVRFLTCVEMTPESRSSRLKGHQRYSFKGKDHPHHQSSTAAPSKLLVISGGDGYEDFRNTGLSELAGRDDSTNHLLLWQV